jgi:hypothetical protein
VEINEEIKQKMVEYLQSFEAGMKKAGEFSAEQAPLVVQEFLAWEFWSAFAAFLICSIIAVATIGTCIWWWRSSKEETEFKALICLIPVLLCLFLQIPIWTSAYSAGKVAVAPRIVVLEKISELVK